MKQIGPFDNSFPTYPSGNNPSNTLSSIQTDSEGKIPSESVQRRPTQPIQGIEGAHRPPTSIPPDLEGLDQFKDPRVMEVRIDLPSLMKHIGVTDLTLLEKDPAFQKLQEEPFKLVRVEALSKRINFASTERLPDLLDFLVGAKLYGPACTLIIQWPNLSDHPHALNKLFEAGIQNIDLNDDEKRLFHNCVIWAARSAINRNDVDGYKDLSNKCTGILKACVCAGVMLGSPAPAQGLLNTMLQLLPDVAKEVIKLAVEAAKADVKPFRTLENFAAFTIGFSDSPFAPEFIYLVLAACHDLERHGKEQSKWQVRVTLNSREANKVLINAKIPNLPWYESDDKQNYKNCVKFRARQLLDEKRVTEFQALFLRCSDELKILLLVEGDNLKILKDLSPDIVSASIGLAVEAATKTNSPYNDLVGLAQKVYLFKGTPLAAEFAGLLDQASDTLRVHGHFTVLEARSVIVEAVHNQERFILAQFQQANRVDEIHQLFNGCSDCHKGYILLSCILDRSLDGFQVPKLFRRTSPDIVKVSLEMAFENARQRKSLGNLVEYLAPFGGQLFEATGVASDFVALMEAAYAEIRDAGEITEEDFEEAVTFVNEQVFAARSST